MEIIRGKFHQDKKSFLFLYSYWLVALWPGDQDRLLNNGLSFAVEMHFPVRNINSNEFGEVLNDLQLVNNCKIRK